MCGNKSFNFLFSNDIKHRKYIKYNDDINHSRASHLFTYKLWLRRIWSGTFTDSQCSRSYRRKGIIELSNHGFQTTVIQDTFRLITHTEKFSGEIFMACLITKN